ncbi:unnamed protein product [Mytilus coruscus]|uniref:Endonuclease/exonuclease/phosphatase domain-containing protein n=1 Tax=Mytilus coruscus TaxID=42192 RepID=A0A6J8DC30_MYTCO|nr:unnamed protein product [Mytilus coruscus]
MEQCCNIYYIKFTLFHTLLNRIGGYSGTFLANSPLFSEPLQLPERNAPKASGGVGLLIKNWIFKEYEYETIDITRDGVICGKFQSKSTDFNFIVFSCYLPPKNSVWGRDSQGYFAHILSDIYEQCDTDAIFLCGDFNSRIGSLKDYSDFDELPLRLSLDKTVNQHGNTFLEFLNESKMCVLNGRFDQDKDNFTFISGRGKSVVDYICVPQDYLDQCISFETITTRSIAEKANLFNFLGERSKLPDHSVLVTEFKSIKSTFTDNIPGSPTQSTKRFKLKLMPNDMFSSDMCKLALQNVISHIEQTRETQENIDNI